MMGENMGMSPADMRAVMDGNYNNDGCGWGGGFIWIIVLFALMFGGGFGFGGGWGRNGAGLTQVELQQGFDTAEITRKLDGLSYGLADSTYALNNTVQQGFFGTQRDILTGFADMGYRIAENRFAAKECCCETNRNIDAVRYDAQKNTCDITTAIHAEGEATRALLVQQENQRLRDELGQARDAIGNYHQSQYILGQIGRYYTNPPCAGPVQYVQQRDCSPCGNY